MIVHWIWLATRTAVREWVKVELVRHFGDAEGVYYAADFACVEDLTENEAEALKDRDLRQAEQILARCDHLGIHLLTYRDAAYPRRLRNIPDPPLVFYYKGCLPDFDGLPVIGVVGTRNASAYGLTCAKRLGYQIAKCGGVVVSGMAAGIDGMAMGGALTASGTVVGVLGCGVDVVYPQSNRALFEDTERYGCLMSEFPPGTPPVKWNFPRRNRVISGLSCGVLIVEAPEKSGALITARQAADQGRDVFVVPGNIDVASFVGSNRLLRDGAIAVSSGWDVVGEYEGSFPGRIRKFDRDVKMEAYPDETEVQEGPAPAKVAQKSKLPKRKPSQKQAEDKIAIDNPCPSSYIDLQDTLPNLSSVEQTIVRAIGETDKLVDDVIAETGLPAAKVLATLTILEVRGVVQRLPGRRVTLKGK